MLASNLNRDFPPLGRFAGWAELLLAPDGKENPILGDKWTVGDGVCESAILDGTDRLCIVGSTVPPNDAVNPIVPPTLIIIADPDGYAVAVGVVTSLN